MAKPADELAATRCVPCRAGTPALGDDDIRRLLPEIPNWVLVAGAGDAPPRIERRFAFRNFADALSFVNRVAQAAEEQDHHPDISFGWGFAVIAFSTHAIGGLHRNDFVMAARVDRLA